MSEENTAENAEKPAAPFLKVLKGNPTDAQVATLTVLFAGLAAGAGAEEDKGPRNDWGRYEDAFHTVQSFNPASFLNVQFY